ncbi:MAG: DUF4493 domain-containing protein [Bacteroidaceae bacterium]|nr:DUF4493 domain-containing protein [Bacteroidaceae bacterium]
MKIIKSILLCTTLLTLVSCQSEEQQPTATTGTIVLSLGGTELYTELQTRAEAPVADLSKYVFTLNGTTISGATITDLVLDVDYDGTAKVNAGTYTITADNKVEANRFSGSPWYSETSESFSVSVNATTPVSIALGKPKNARIAMAIDDSFNALYEDPVLTLSDGDRTQTLASLEDACYFIVPASGALAYTLTANAKEDSHASDMPQATGYVDIQAGYNTTIILKANPASGVIIPVTGNDYNGTFDVKRR